MSQPTKYIVRLTKNEREELQSMVDDGTGSKEQRKRARILLKADCSQHDPPWSDERIAEYADSSLSTVHRVRQRLVCEGFEVAVYRKPQSDRLYRKLDGQGEAQLIALACSPPPEGFSRWTLKLLADKLVALELVESISRECVRQSLKKTS